MTSVSQPVLQFHGKGLINEKLSILLVGTSDFCHLMYNTFQSLSPKFLRVNFSISITESVEQILKSSASIHVDFIVFLMNSEERHCVEQVERNICLIDSLYLCDKILLINCCNHLGDNKMGLSNQELFSLSQKYRLQMIHGNIKDEKSCENLARRILHFSSVVCGVKTGFPMVFDFPSFTW